MRQNLNLLVLNCIKYKESAKCSKFLKLLVNVLEAEDKVSEFDFRHFESDNDLVDFSFIISPDEKENEVQFITYTSLSETEFRSYESKMNLTADVFWNKDIIEDYLKKNDVTRVLIDFKNTKDQKSIGKSELTPSSKGNSFFILKIV